MRRKVSVILMLVMMLAAGTVSSFAGNAPARPMAPAVHVEYYFDHGIGMGRAVATVKRVGNTSGYEFEYGCGRQSWARRMPSGLRSKYEYTRSVKADDKYWVRVRAYRTINGRRYFSGWSVKRYFVIGKDAESGVYG